MGKAKKSEATTAATKMESTAAEKKPAAGKKPAVKSKAAAAPISAPMIDTNLAAQNAARALIAGLGKTGSGPQTESAMFKQMKADLNKPVIGSNSNLLNPSVGNLGQQKNSAHQKNQGTSYHANVSNTGVPRRNPG